MCLDKSFISPYQASHPDEERKHKIGEAHRQFHGPGLESAHITSPIAIGRTQMAIERQYEKNIIFFRLF